MGVGGKSLSFTSILALILVLILLLSPYVVLAREYGLLTDVSFDVLWSCFLEYLRGGQPGIVKINVVPEYEGKPFRYESAIIFIHNFTHQSRPRPEHGKEHSEIIYCGGSTKISFKISRIPLMWGWDEIEAEPRFIYLNYEYAVFMYAWSGGRPWTGASLVRFEPKKPLTEVAAKLAMEPLPAEYQSAYGAGSGPILPSYGTIEEVVERYYLMPAVQLHSIEGISVRFYAYYGNYLYYTQKRRVLDWTYQPITDWQSLGDKITQAEDTTGTPWVSNGEKRWAMVCVKYRYERWKWIVGSMWQYEEIVTPISFGGRDLGDAIQCSLCGGNPVGNALGYVCGVPDIELPLGDGEKTVEVSGIKISFSVAYGPITLTVELWKEIQKGTSAQPAKIQIHVNTWVKNYLVTFDDNTNWKVVHFTWQDTPP
ncbi:MAG: hypothetical protein QW262_07910 [Candidatus Bathyarchaeia archaeon]